MKMLPDLIKNTRRIRNIPQRKLAKEVGITQSSLSQYENHQSTLSKKTVRKLLDALNINPECMDDETAKPYKSPRLHKIIVKNHALMGFDYTLLEYLLSLNHSVKIVFLRSVFIEFKPDPMITKIILTEFVHAIFLQDQDNSFFLFRQKKRNAPLLNEIDLQSLIENIAKKTGTNTTFHTTMIPRSLTEKINNFTVEREDLEKISCSPDENKRELGFRRVTEYLEKNYTTVLDFYNFRRTVDIAIDYDITPDEVVDIIVD